MKQPLEQLVLDGLRRRYLTWEHYIIKAAYAYRDLKDREQQT